MGMTYKGARRMGADAAEERSYDHIRRNETVGEFSKTCSPWCAKNINLYAKLYPLRSDFAGRHQTNTSEANNLRPNIMESNSKIFITVLPI